MQGLVLLQGLVLWASIYIRNESRDGYVQVLENAQHELTGEQDSYGGRKSYDIKHTVVTVKTLNKVTSLGICCYKDSLCRDILSRDE